MKIFGNSHPLIGRRFEKRCFFGKLIFATHLESASKRLKADNLCAFSMHPVSKCIAVHLTGKKSEPSTFRLFQFPNVETPLANKCYFNADRVEFKWNRTGTVVL